MHAKDRRRSQIEYFCNSNEFKRQSGAIPPIFNLQFSFFNIQFGLSRIKHLSAILSLALLAALASSAGADPTVTLSYDYYEIEGRTADELRKQMDRHGIRWTNRNIYDAYTGWNVDWRYRYRMVNGECSMGTVTTTVKDEFRLPRWTDYAAGSDALQKKWDDYMQALRQHENGHKDFGIKAAVEIERALAELEPAEGCEELAEIANGLGRQIISEYAAAERAYDAETNFGEAQGAVFP